MPAPSGRFGRLLDRPWLTVGVSTLMSLSATYALSYLLSGQPPGRVGTTIALVAGAGIAAVIGGQHRRSHARLSLAYAELAAQLTEVERLRRELEAQACRDALTGLANRRGLDEAFTAARALSSVPRSLALAIIDLDGFKEINDRAGHLTGDRVLMRVAAALSAGVRDSDTVARYGGDEFVLLLPGQGRSDAAATVARLRDTLAEVIDDPTLGPLSCSVGVAVAPEDGHTLDALLGVADRHMYAEKRRPAATGHA